MTIARPLPPLELLQERFEETEPGVLRHRRDQRGSMAGSIAGTRHLNGYWVIRFRSAQLRRSHLVWKIHHDRDPLGVIVHSNGDKSDDRIENLRDEPLGVSARDGSSYVICFQDERGWGWTDRFRGWTVRFRISCWPDEDHEQLAADLHELIALEIDAVYAKRVGRQKPLEATAEGEKEQADA
jgi:hypothetical protein